MVYTLSMCPATRGIGEQIRALRARRGLTQATLADRARLSRVYIQKLELGERASPSLPVLERIATALGATVHIDLRERGRR
jgi:transcriptional regulator with XRE-family HTH domain